MYLTYNEYLEMGGALPETIFYDLEVESETLIDYYTFCRLQNDNPEKIDGKIKFLVYKLISLLNTKNSMLENVSMGNGIIKSQSNDGVSTTYGGMDASTIYKTSDDTIKSTIRQYLNGVRDSKGRLVLYRGIYGDE